MEKHERKVIRLLKDAAKYEARQDNGDFVATEVLIDMARAIKKADLTDRQREAIRLIYIEDMDEEKAAALAGVKRQSLHDHKKAGVRKIAEIYEAWGYLDEAAD